jgi:hypothetical protein
MEIQGFMFLSIVYWALHVLQATTVTTNERGNMGIWTA